MDLISLLLNLQHTASKTNCKYRSIRDSGFSKEKDDGAQSITFSREYCRNDWSFSLYITCEEDLLCLLDFFFGTLGIPQVETEDITVLDVSEFWKYELVDMY